MAKEDILNRIRTAHANKQDIVFPMNSMPADISVEDIASEIQSLTGRDVRASISEAQKLKSNFRIPFSRESATPTGEGRATGMREKYPSEKLFGPVTEGVLQAAGGLSKLGRMAGPTGAAVSMGLAGAIGGGVEAARQGVQLAGGEPIAPKSLGESMTRIGSRAVASAGTEGLGRAVFGLGGKLFKPTPLSPVQQDLVDLAKEKGIPLTATDIVKSKGLARFENILDNMPLSGGMISKYSVRKLNAFKEYLTKTISKSGTPKDKEQVGELFQSVLNKRSQAARDEVNNAYAIANDLIDSRALADAKELKEEAANIIASETRGIPSMQNQSLIKSAQEILDKKFWNYEELNANRAKLGEQIDKEMLSDVRGFGYRATDTARKWTRLKTALDNSIDTFFKDQPAEAQAALEIAKKTAKKNIETYRNKDILKLVNSNPEKIVEMVVKRNNVTGIKLVKNAVGPTGFKPIKQRFMSDLIEKSNLGVEEVGKSFEPSRIFSELSKYEPSTLKEIFSKQELLELNKIAKLSMAMKTSERMAGNTSRTATTLIGAAGLGGAGVAAVSHPVLAATAILTAPTLAKLYLSESGRKLLTEGLSVSPTSKEALKFATRVTNFGLLNKAMAEERK